MQTASNKYKDFPIVFVFNVYQFMVMAYNAPPAAAVRVLADFIFEFRFHSSSHLHFHYHFAQHCRLTAR